MKYSKLAYGLFLSGFVSAFSYAQISPLNGFYGEVAGGGLILNSDFTSQAFMGPFSNPLSSPFETNNYATSQSLKTADSSVLGQISVGFGHQLDVYPVYFGVDVFANDARREVNTNFNSFNSLFSTDLGTILNINFISQSFVKLKNFEYGADVKAGLLLTPTTLLYGLIGEAINRLEYKFNNSFLINYPASGFSLPIANFNNILFKRDLRGLRLGGGIERYISNNFALDLNYIYTNYGHIETYNPANLTSLIGDFEFPFVTLFSPNGFIVQSKTAMSSQEVFLGLKYYFNPLGINSCPLCEPLFNFSGFYAGIEGGGAETVAKINSITTANNLFFFSIPSIPETISNSQNTRTWNTSGIGEIYIGYGLLCVPKPYYLSAEIFSNYSSNKITVESSATKNDINIFITPPPDVTPLYIATLLANTQIKLNELEYGIDIKPGIYLSPSSLFYGRIGVAVNDIDLQSDNILLLSFPNVGFNTPEPSILNKKSEKYKLGLRLGLGLEKYLNHNFAINVDYIFTDYGDINSNNIGAVNNIFITGLTPNVVVTPNSFSNHTSTTITSHQFMGGIKYYFDV